MENTQKKLIFCFLQYLENLKKGNRVDPENVDVASQCISEAFQLDIKDESQKSLYSIGNLSLEDVFAEGVKHLQVQPARKAPQSSNSVANKENDLWKKWMEKLEAKGYFEGCAKGTPEYEDRLKKAESKFAERFGAQVTAEKDTNASVDSEAAFTEAEELKAKGNAALGSQDYQAAIEFYNKALTVCPSGRNSHIYHCNLAAAQSHSGDHLGAIDSCEKAIELNPSYSKAHSRKGFAYFQLGEYEAAVNAYEKALELDPQNQPVKNYLEQARGKLASTETGSRAFGQDSVGSTDGSDPPAGLPEGLGGLGGLGGLLNNPMMAQMAQQMMQNPQMMQMAQNVMQNPEMLGQMLGGMGGMEGLANMMGGGAGNANSQS